jgi:hypothetical protein
MQGSPAATQRELAEFVDADGTLLFWPEELVFKDGERQSSAQLVDAAKLGQGDRNPTGDLVRADSVPSQ